MWILTPPTSPGASPICASTVPVANATITPSPLSHQVHTGDPVTLRCSVQVGSAPVTFTWLHNGQEVAQGPVLELGDIDVGHSGTYQCASTLGSTPIFLSVHVITQYFITLCLGLEGQVSAMESKGDTVTLRCRGWRNRSVTLVQFYRGDKEVRRSLPGTELSLSPLQLHHSGQYHCQGLVYSEESSSWVQRISAPVTVTVHGEPHPHSLPGSPGWGHSAPSGDPQTCLRTPITAQTPHPCRGSHPSSIWVSHQIPQPYPNLSCKLLLCFPITAWVPLLISLSLTGSLHPSLGQSHPSLISPHGPQVPPSPPGARKLPWNSFPGLPPAL
uniref:Ig-like domain-containing protein n=1 Tax=Zosterops lateralis melanops TaxID=1220523 RepID=A0A8D2PNT5_ZOSLA